MAIPEGTMFSRNILDVLNILQKNTLVSIVLEIFLHAERLFIYIIP
jgi:hypothetical protein